MPTESIQNQILFALRDEFLTKMKTPDYHYDAAAVELGLQLSDLDNDTTFPILSLYPIHGEPDFDGQNNVLNEKVDFIIEGYLPAIPEIVPVIAANKLLEDMRNVILRAPKNLISECYDVRYKKEFNSAWDFILPTRENPDLIVVILTFSVAYRYFPRG